MKELLHICWRDGKSQAWNGCCTLLFAAQINDLNKMPHTVEQLIRKLLKKSGIADHAYITVKCIDRWCRQASEGVKRCIEPSKRLGVLHHVKVNFSDMAAPFMEVIWSTTEGNNELLMVYGKVSDHIKSSIAKAIVEEKKPLLSYTTDCWKTKRPFAWKYPINVDNSEKIKRFSEEYGNCLPDGQGVLVSTNLLPPYNSATSGSMWENISVRSEELYRNLEKKMEPLLDALRALANDVHIRFINKGQAAMADILHGAGIPLNIVEKLLLLSQKGPQLAEVAALTPGMNKHRLITINIAGVSFGDIAAIDPDMRSALVFASLCEDKSIKTKVLLLNPAGVFEVNEFVRTVGGAVLPRVYPEPVKEKLIGKWREHLHDGYLERHIIDFATDMQQVVAERLGIMCLEDELDEAVRIVKTTAQSNSFLIKNIYGLAGINCNVWNSEIERTIRAVLAARELSKIVVSIPASKKQRITKS